MRALKFNLYGNTAFFKKPDVNTYYYFTYSNIHKVALLGIFGAVCGLGGYNQQKKPDKKEKGGIFPEFYEKLKDIKVAIVPNESSFTKKIQYFNNSVGYASKEEGGNLIVKEQWIENPKWEIYVLLDGNANAEEIANRIINSEFAYIPYLGKNDHYANITDAKYVELQEVQSCNKLDGLFLKTILESFDADDEDYELTIFKYEENLPTGIEEQANQYIFGKFIFTNNQLKLNDCSSIYKSDKKNLFFF
ncbi:MAG: type I-B CRISPR-associated protein Cas5b [bacterium]